MFHNNSGIDRYKVASVRKNNRANTRGRGTQYISMIVNGKTITRAIKHYRVEFMERA